MLFSLTFLMILNKINDLSILVNITLLLYQRQQLS